MAARSIVSSYWSVSSAVLADWEGLMVRLAASVRLVAGAAIVVGIVTSCG